LTEPTAPPPPPVAPPAYGAPGAPPPPRAGFPTWGIVAIIISIFLVGGGVTAVVLLTDNEEPEPVETPFTPVPDSPLSPGLSSPSPAGASPSPAVANSPCIAAPPEPLIDCVPERVGSFVLNEWDNAPQFAQTFNANQAIEVLFRRANGTELQHFLFSYPTHTEATVEKESYVRGFEATGYTVVDQTREKGLDITRLQARQEVLVWSNGRLMGVVLGPFDVTTGFFLELPY
jgi:hypothetical protein